jgi:hypothetical protein
LLAQVYDVRFYSLADVTPVGMKPDQSGLSKLTSFGQSSDRRIAGGAQKPGFSVGDRNCGFRSSRDHLPIAVDV